jgi:arabinofuranosyltransferase
MGADGSVKLRAGTCRGRESSIMTESENIVAAAALLAVMAAIAIPYKASAPLGSRLSTASSGFLLACWLASTVVGIEINVNHFDMLVRNDDAYITYRYAENLANGMGMVYNAGERVLGTTTILFTLMLAAAKASVPAANIVSVSVLVNLGFFALATLIGLRLLNHAHCDRASRRHLLSMVFFLAVIAVDQGFRRLMFGMEIGLVIFLTVAALYLLYERSLLRLPLVLFLLILTRIDSAIFVGLCLLYLVVFARETPMKRRVISLSLFVSLVALYVVIATAYFGSFVPNTLAAKNLVYREFPVQGGFSSFGTFVSDLFRGLFWETSGKLVLFCCFLIGTGRALVRRQSLFLLAAFGAFGYFLFLAVFQITVGRLWYTPQYMLLYYVVCALGFRSVADFVAGWIGRLPALRERKLLRDIAVVTALSVAVSAFVVLPAVETLEKSEQIHRKIFVEDDTLVCLGQHIRQMNLGSTSRLLIGDIGKVGYYSGAYILDYVGLVSPQVFEYYRDGTGLFGVVMEELPSLVALQYPKVLGSHSRIPARAFWAWFTNHYARIETGCPSDALNYPLFIRKDRGARHGAPLGI